MSKPSGNSNKRQNQTNSVNGLNNPLSSQHSNQIKSYRELDNIMQQYIANKSHIILPPMQENELNKRYKKLKNDHNNFFKRLNKDRNIRYTRLKNDHSNFLKSLVTNELHSMDQNIKCFYPCINPFIERLGRVKYLLSVSGQKKQIWFDKKFYTYKELNMVLAQGKNVLINLINFSGCKQKPEIVEEYINKYVEIFTNITVLKQLEKENKLQESRNSSFSHKK